MLLEDLHEELELLLVLREELVVALHEGHSSLGAVICDGEGCHSLRSTLVVGSKTLCLGVSVEEARR